MRGGVPGFDAGGGTGGGGSRAAAGLFADWRRAGGFFGSDAGGSVDAPDALFGDVDPVGSALMMLTGGIEADEGKLNRDTAGAAEALGGSVMADGT